MSGLIITIDGHNVTRFVDGQQFPEYLEQSFKGTGLFDFEVRPLTFRLLPAAPVAPARGMPVQIRRAGSGRMLLNGFVDELREDGERLEVTVYPLQLHIKDTVIGTEKNMKDSAWQPGDPVSKEDEIVREFHSQGAESVPVLVQRVLNQVNAQKGTSFTVTAESVPQHGSAPSRKFFGNILDRVDRASWWWKLLGPIAVLIAWLTEDDYQIRHKDGIYYLIKRDFGLFQKLWIVSGGLLNVSAKVSISRGWLFSSRRLGIHVPSSAINLFDWGRWTIPENDWRLPNVGVQFTVYQMVAGGLEVVREDSMSVFPQPDFSPTEAEITSQFGAIVNPSSSSNITTGAIRAYLDEEGYRGDTVEILARFDLDDNNSYAIVTARSKRRNDHSGETLVLSFETPFDVVYQVHYRNATAGQVLRDLCIVSNRYWYADGSGLVWMLPRGTGSGNLVIDRRRVLGLERTHQKNPDGDVAISRYEEGERGAVQSWGIVLRKNEWEALQKIYQDELSRARIETRLKVLSSPDQEWQLARAVEMDGRAIGMVIEEKMGILEPVSELTVEGVI